MSWELKATDGYVLAINSEVVKLGRGTENTIVLNDPAVSRFHLNLYVKGQDLIAEDAGSQNGFSVNGQIIKGAVKLSAGDRVGIGSKEYLVRAKGSSLDLEGHTGAKQLNPGAGLSGVSAQRRTLGSTQHAAHSAPLQQHQGNPRVKLYLGGIAIVAAAALYFRSEERNTNKTGAQRVPATAEIAEALKMDGKEKFRQKGISEVRAEAKFRETLRDFYNRNYSRSITGFNEVLRENGDHEEAREHLKTAEVFLSSDMKKLYEDAVRSNDVMQYSRAKGQTMRVLTLMAEQIPSYARTIGEEASRLPGSTSNTSQDEILLQVPCKNYKANRALSQDEKAQVKENVTICEEAQKLLKEVRQRLGDEDTLKEVR